jgi:KDO2-lipid IV(A) lauroyltransferase
MANRKHDLPLIRRLRYRAEYFGFRLVGLGLAALPIETAAAVSGKVWRWVAPHLSRHKRALVHLALALPECPQAERERIARDMWENLGRTFAESFHLSELAQGERIAFADPAQAQAIGKAYRKAIVCSSHIGNWELAIVAATRIGLKPAGVYQKIKNPFVDSYVTRTRLPLYPGGLHEKGKEAARHLVRYARNGGTVALLADLRENRSISVPFFGHPARSTTFPATLARTLGLPLLVGVAVREPGTRFRFEIEEIGVPVTADKQADIEAATAALQACFERQIRAHPEQWMWAHRRWG